VRGGVRRAVQRRETLWIDEPFSDTGLSVIGGTILSSLSAAGLALRPFTIVRSHLEVYMRSDQIAASEHQAGAIGTCIVSDQASAIGVTAVPTPVTDIASDLWMLHQVMFAEVSRGASGFASIGRGWTIDSKAMRKVEEGEDFLTVAEFSAVGSGFNLLVAGRYLLKLH